MSLNVSYQRIKRINSTVCTGQFVWKIKLQLFFKNEQNLNGLLNFHSLTETVLEKIGFVLNVLFKTFETCHEEFLFCRGVVTFFLLCHFVKMVNLNGTEKC